MADYSALKATIDNNVNTNGSQAITGAILNDVLNEMVDVLGEGYTFLGVATTSTNPATPEGKAYYLAGGAGDYNIGNIHVSADEVALLVWNGTAWSKVVSPAASKEEVSQLGQNFGVIRPDSTTPLRANTIIMTSSQVSAGDVVYMSIQNTNGVSQVVQFYDTDGNAFNSTYRYGWPIGGGDAQGEIKSYVITIPSSFGSAKTLWGHGIAVLHLSLFPETISKKVLSIEGQVENINGNVQSIAEEINETDTDITLLPTWQNGNFSVINGNITYTTYNTRARLSIPLALQAGETIKVETIHQDADIICAYIKDGYAVQLNENWDDVCEFTATDACDFMVQVKVGVLTSFYNDIALYIKMEKATLRGAVVKLMSGSVESDDIVSLNDKKRTTIPILSNLARAYKVDGTNGRKPLVLLHFSDIHGNAGNLARISDFLTEYSQYIDGAISTGDVLAVKYDNENIWGDAPAGMLNVIGNHDCQTQDASDPNVIGVSPFASSWYLVNPTIPYNNFIKPHVANWGVTQPANAESQGKLYYYKDYTTEMVRLIVVDGNYWDATQLSWLQTTLASARTAGYSVMIASHYSAFASTRQPNNAFDSLDADTIVPLSSEIASAVKDYVDAGGDFICYIGGHRHADIFGLGISFPEQLQILVNTASDAAGLQNDVARVAGTKSQDLFNILAIDTYSKLIKIWRVGADYDHYGRHKGTLCWKYDTQQMIYVD